MPHRFTPPASGPSGPARSPAERLTFPPSWGLDAPPDNPLTLFADWMSRADAAGVASPTAVTLSTASPNGVVSARTVLVKAWDAQRLVFETESYSRKGTELAENPHVAMTVYWREVHRQLCITGRAAELPAALSDEMWSRRGRANQAASVVSREGETLPSVTAELELHDRVDALVATGIEIRRPETYLAYGVTPLTVEFWEGSADRLHRRVLFERPDSDLPWGWRRIKP
jgi:pyridoxamine 5'-phosphate oxidase